MKKEKKRCDWSLGNPLMVRYHDEEWGVPKHDDKILFEYLILDAAQAGLSWAIVLKKREGYRKAFLNYDAEKIARFGAKDAARLMKDPGIVRNRLKIQSAIANAKGFLAVRKEFGSFDRYIWSFVKGRTIQNRIRRMKDIPAVSPESVAMSKDLIRRGFRFVGPTICYAFMQAAGLVNDHLAGCHRRKACR
jgi:DNA-3-methyladenine glycosylase I